MPSETSITPEAVHTRNQMLEKVRTFWITDVLDHSLSHKTQLLLDQVELPDMARHPTNLLIQRPDRDARPLPPGTSIAAAYDELGHELLILGAPGAGKTTLLLELTRDLLDRAEQDVNHPIPVVFPLAGWAASRRARGDWLVALAAWAEWRGVLADWLVAELTTRYDVPPAVAAAWIATDQVLPLLDGLDEVAPDDRESCIAAINAFRHEHGLLPLVVSSRLADYEALADRLHLGGAIVVQPLTRTQITAYIEQIGTPLTGLDQALREDGALWEVLDTPLMLNIVTLTYQGLPATAVRTRGTLEERRKQVFAAYMERMLERQANDTRYTSGQTRRWLAWLARGMVRHKQTVFAIEKLQPDWLPRIQQWVPTIGVALGVGLGVALLVALGFGLLGALDRGVSFGLGFGLVFGWAVYHREIRNEDVDHWLRDVLVGTLLGGLLVTSVVGPAGALAGGLVGAVLAVLINSVSIRVINQRLVQELSRPAQPNQGMRLAAQDALLIGALGVLLSAFSIMLIGGLIGALFGGLGLGLIVGLNLGQVVGLISGLASALGYGGATCLQHIVLRTLLWVNGAAPGNYARFLDYVAEHLFLRKVGGSYIFAHPLLMEYFASLE